MHDAFIKAYDKIGSFRYKGEGSLYGWLRTLSINLALDRLRRRRLRPFTLEDFSAADIPEPPDEAVESIPMPVMLEMIASLPPERRAVFNLYCLDDWSHREIAEKLGITEKESAAILHQARMQMKEKIKNYLAAQH